MNDIKGLTVEYPVFNNEGVAEEVLNGTLLEFKSTPEGIMAIVMTDEGNEEGDYCIDIVASGNLLIPKRENQTMMLEMKGAYMN